ncbi:hypothetical protein J2Z65_006271 [Paenibacillus aceris]|uniref:Uncharacterized protein n=1 Tax=Paenibacillus aceris TaxID=869555 RepID=A0ABS4I8L0_9BACL|nr:hypothetical protein [Paenibacillus aceris]
MVFRSFFFGGCAFFILITIFFRSSNGKLNFYVKLEGQRRVAEAEFIEIIGLSQTLELSRGRLNIPLTGNYSVAMEPNHRLFSFL